MRCPYCGNVDTQVKDSRPSEDNTAIRRRRVCADCGGRFISTRTSVAVNGRHTTTTIAGARLVCALALTEAKVAAAEEKPEPRPAAATVCTNRRRDQEEAMRDGGCCGRGDKALAFMAAA